MTDFGRAIERWDIVRQDLEKKGIDPDTRYESDPEKYKHLEQPQPPKGFSYRDIWFDLSPLRPDEFGRQVAARWEKAEMVQAAFNKGKRLERASRSQAEENKKRSDAAIERLKQQV